MSNPPLPYGQTDRIPHGTRATIHGVDVVAIDIITNDRSGCRFCAFHYKGEGLNRCTATPCNSVVWLTVPEYITRRLTS